MNKPTLLAAALWLALAGPVQAQALRANAAALPTTGAVRGAEHIVALVNSEPITSGDVRARLARVQAPEGGSLPPREELERQVLERLIVEKTQLQWAAEIGVKVDDNTLNDAEANVAAQNRLTVPQLHERLQSVGLTPAAFRTNLRNELLLQRVREREVDNRVRISEQDIDAYLREHQQSAGADAVLNLAQVLVAVPDQASPAEVERLRTRAEQIARRAQAGDDFAALARGFSDGPEKQAGGQIGARPADRYPSLFVDATRSLAVGGVTGPVRSGAGFHILKVLDKRNPKLPETQVTQTLARHILLRPSAQLSPQAAADQLARWRQQI
ncbi:peptidylprolyl isomerase, partial [Aquabacterium sp. A08]|uniref:peptidylprolyl isomerase n=1 Tax=Aquabacterium sp. A08 TaxID=2718532 RepID=UPI00141FF1CD